MTDNEADQDLTPWQRLSWAWNQISEARKDLGLEDRKDLKDALDRLDALLLILHPAGFIPPLPVCPLPGRCCGTHHVQP